jgi:histidine triad (HIT) family protein
VLIIPKKPVPRMGEAVEEDKALLGHLMLTAAAIARKLNLTKGYRLVVNNGPDACESIPHLHVHLLGGRRMKWPPG